MTKKRTIKLNLFMLASGHHHGAWRHPDVPRNQDLELAHFASLARTAERGKFDALFLQDLVGVRESLGREAMRHGDHGVVQLDPLLVLASIAAVTEKIGLIATSSTTYNQPFQVARKFSSLDHLSRGRAGWNIVTSTDEEEAHNFSFNETVPHDERYRRAEEFVDVVRGLWDSWEEGAFPRDKKTGVYLEAGKMHHLNHRGKYFKVRGPLNIPRSPQCHPVLVQAGSSAAGQDLSARVADIVFTVNPTLEIAQEFYAKFKTLIRAKGRDPDSVVVMPGIFPVIADTEEKARKKFNELQDLVHPAFGVGILGKMIGNFDLTKYPLDGPLPDLPVTDEQQGRQQNGGGKERDLKPGEALQSLGTEIAPEISGPNANPEDGTYNREAERDGAKPAGLRGCGRGAIILLRHGFVLPDVLHGNGLIMLEIPYHRRRSPSRARYRKGRAAGRLAGRR